MVVFGQLEDVLVQCNTVWMDDDRTVRFQQRTEGVGRGLCLEQEFRDECQRHVDIHHSHFPSSVEYWQTEGGDGIGIFLFGVDPSSEDGVCGVGVGIPRDGAIGDVGCRLHELAGVELQLLRLVDMGQQLPVDIA